MASKIDLDWASVKFVFYDTGSNAKLNLYTLLKFIDQRFVYNNIKVLMINCFPAFNNLFKYNVKILALIYIFLSSEKCLSEHDVNENKFYFYFFTLAANYIGRHCDICNTNLIVIYL